MLYMFTFSATDIVGSTSLITVVIYMPAHTRQHTAMNKNTYISERMGKMIKKEGEAYIERERCIMYFCTFICNSSLHACIITACNYIMRSIIAHHIYIIYLTVCKIG